MKSLIAITLALISTGAMAEGLFGPTPRIPQLYTDGLTRLQQPNLTKPEKAAFSLMESLQQMGEAYVQANGCPLVSTVGAVEIYSDQYGTGDMTVTTAGATLFATTREVASDSFRGTVQGVWLDNGKLFKTGFTKLVGTYRFNRVGTIMEGDAIFSLPNPTTGGTSPDVFTGRVIKDFYLYPQQYQGDLRNFTLDWGLQVLNKKGYPVSKWWQRSFSVKDDGIEGITRFVKHRIAGGVPCAITVNVRGLNNVEQFNSTGWVQIIQAPLPR